MDKDKTYKKLYFDLKKQFDTFIKHRHYCPSKCKYCKEWYKEVLNETKKVRNKQLKKNLTEVWKCLWLNNCKDFDIIAHTFEVR